MPRSFQIKTKWRLCLLALFLIVPLVLDHSADAQKRKPAQAGNAQVAPGGQELQKKNLTRLISSETTDGASITIFSDLPLNDYSAYRGGDRFYVLIPGADATRIAAGLRGRGFADVRTQKRGNDVLLSFRLLAGASARVNQKFNRLEILITVPALVAVNSTTNANVRSQTDPSQSTTTTATTNTGSRSQTGSRNSSRGSSGANSSGSGDYGLTGPIPSPSTRNQESTNPPDGIPVGPDGRVQQTGSTDVQPNTQPSPIVVPSVSPPSDQVAQLQPTPEIPGTNSQVPATTTSSAPSTGSSFGAQIKQNWLFILLAVAIAGLIAWVVFARSRGDQSEVEKRIETIRETRHEPKAYPTSSKVVPTPAVDKPRAVVETKSDVEAKSDVAAKSFDAKDLVAPVVAGTVGAVIADKVLDEPAEEVVEEPVVEPAAEPVVEPEVERAVEPVFEPAKPVAAEQASADVASLLAGGSYDDASIATEHPEARQMVAAELLAALAGRNIVRHDRARQAFIKHGYFDDATRTLRTADSPGERASAARSLGLVRDESGTPHLVAALEDSSPEVRRAAVESLAEVRDPSAVAPLEALRDREKSRKVPKSLIQHAIEASVVGRAKVEVPPPVSSTTTPLPAGVEAYPVADEPAIKVSVPSLDDYDLPEIEVLDPGMDTESEFPIVLDSHEATDAARPSDVHEIEVVGTDADATRYGDVTLDSTEGPLHDFVDTSGNEWIDMDVGRSSVSPPSEATSNDPLELDNEAQLGDSSRSDVLSEVPDVADLVESAPLISEASSLPVVETEPEMGGATQYEDERGLDIAGASEREIDIAGASEREIEVVGGGHEGVSAATLQALASEDASERASAIDELGKAGGEDAFREVSAAFDDPSPDVRNAAARALFNLNPDRAGSFTRALREASPERRRNIGGALSSSGLATDAIGHLMGESREKTYDAFSLLFLMAKAGEVQPLMRAVEEHPNNEVRLAVVKLLALSGQQEILPAFRRLAVRGSLPTEVRSAVMEAIYQISSQAPGGTA